MSSSKLVGPGISGLAVQFNHKQPPRHSPTESDNVASAQQAKHLSHIVGNRNSMHHSEADNKNMTPFSSQVQVPLSQKRQGTG